MYQRYVTVVDKRNRMAPVSPWVPGDRDMGLDRGRNLSCFRHVFMALRHTTPGVGVIRSNGYKESDTGTCKGQRMPGNSGEDMMKISAALPFHGAQTARGLCKGNTACY